MNSTKKMRVLVAMSGGVDSSVAAALLARAGHEVIGVTMRLFNSPFEGSGRLSKSCCSLEDVEDARTTCRIIDARHYYMNFEREFEEHVINYFVGEYERGRTPHPCLACNDRLKFDFLMSRADVMNADMLATGHYARISEDQNGNIKLLRGADATKDQSYVLYNLRQQQISRLLFPVGGFSKDEIRDIARKEGLPVADKADSQDICFIPSGGYKKFVEKRLSTSTPGVVIDIKGNVLGEHDGIHQFTIGQRKGLPINVHSVRPTYVTSINSRSGTITVGCAEDLLRHQVYVSSLNWISGQPPASNVGMTARVRYRGAEELATVEMLSDDSARVVFCKPMRAVTPGQAIVFYRGEEALGGGFIELEPPDSLYKEQLFVSAEPVRTK